jgi:hypothetical protein
MRATTPDQCWQRLQCNDGGGKGATRTTTKAHWSHNCIFCCHYCWHHAIAEKAVLAISLLLNLGAAQQGRRVLFLGEQKLLFEG